MTCAPHVSCAVDRSKRLATELGMNDTHFPCQWVREKFERYGDKSVNPVRCDDVRGPNQEPLRLDLLLKLSRITPVICTQGAVTDQKVAPGRRALGPVR